MTGDFRRRLVFFCPSSTIPSGGVKQIYRIVKLLKELGLNVVLVLDNNGEFNKTWLKIDSDIEPLYNPNLFLHLRKKTTRNNIFFRTIKTRFKFIVNYLNLSSVVLWCLRKDDVLIIPEIWVNDFQGAFPNNNIIILNQNCFYTIKNYAYLENVKCVVAVSDYSYNYLKLIYNSDKVSRISLGINTENFSYQGEKKKIISYMPRKRPDDIEQLLFLAKLCKAFNDWEYINISNCSELEVAGILKKSLIFLSTSDSEGFGLPPAEAMSCGCIVVGYDGGGGQEFLNKGLSFTIQSGDILGYFNCLTEIVTKLNINFNYYDELRRSASDYITNHYCLETERISVQETWVKLLSNI